MLDPLRHRYFLERGSHLRIEIVRAKELAELQYRVVGLRASRLRRRQVTAELAGRAEDGPERAAAARAKKKDRGE